jgi:TolB-like protein
MLQTGPYHTFPTMHPAPQKAHYLKFGEALNACLGLGCGLKVLITFDGKPRKCTTERLTAQLQSRFEGSKPPDEETVKKWRQGRRLPTTANFKRLIAVLRTESVFSTNSDPKASEEHIKAARLDAIAHLEAVYGRYCDPSERILEGHDRIACPDRASESDSVLSPSSVAQPVSVTIAVLPFVNFSEDLAQEFFCDGMTEEIAAALAKVPDLHVVGRSSAFQFKGAGKDLRAVGQALSARYLIDGSVRKAKGHVRISAQLIDVGNGTQLWSEIYDREIKDVFAVQEEIAQAIAASLRVPLGLDEGEFLVHTWTAHLDSYEDYLRARALLRAGAGPEPGGPVTAAANLLERVIGHDRAYAPAWALLAEVYALIPTYASAFFAGPSEELRRLVDEWFPKADAAAKQAVGLAPNSGHANSSLALVQYLQGHFRQAENSFNRALELDPVNPDALHLYSSLLANIGKLKEAIEIRQRLRELEPLVAVFNANTASYLWLGGQNDAALAMLLGLPQEHPFVAREFALLYAAEGDYDKAADAVLKASTNYNSEIVSFASAMLRSGGTRIASPGNAPYLGFFSLLYAFTTAPDRALDFFDVSHTAGFWPASDLPKFWHPSFAASRKTDRFKMLMRKAGLVDYWQERGWPEPSIR